MAETVGRTQHLGYRVVRWVGHGTDGILLLLGLTLLLTLLPRLVPDLAYLPAMQQLHAWCDAAHAPLANLHPVYLGSYARRTLAAVVLLFLVRNLLNWCLDKIALGEEERRKRALRQAAGAPAAAVDSAEERQRREAACRRVAVAAYAEAKAVLEGQKQELAFLSLDLAGSTKMKDGEDSYMVEHAFAGYRRMVERIVTDHGVYKGAWTPDGQMFAFRLPDDAVLAAQEILAALPRFNREYSKLKTPFRLRAGINCGTLSVDDATPMEQVIDEAVDVAGHLQKYCTPGELWIAAGVHERLCARDGFAANGQQVDGRTVYAWQPPAEEKPAGA